MIPPLASLAGWTEVAVNSVPPPLHMRSLSWGENELCKNAIQIRVDELQKYEQQWKTSWGWAEPSSALTKTKTG